MELLQTFLGSMYWQVTGAALLVAIFAFLANMPHRAAVDAALKVQSGGKPPLSFFDLSSGDADAAKTRKTLVVPERLWTYDNRYLDDFARAASSVHVSRYGTALKRYIKQTLRWDILFAIALGLFAALFDSGVATALLPYHLYTSCALLLLACMGIVYGAADVAEDFKLASILDDWCCIHDSPGGDSAKEIIDRGEAAAVNFLTRVKIVAIILSGVGVLVFLALSLIAKHANTIDRANPPMPLSQA
jgi:hypothetical protein